MTPEPTDSLPSDPALPQLENAWDPAWMRGAFQRGLKPVADTAVKIERCELERFRHRAAKRAILLYRLRWTDASTREPRALWATGSLYPGQRARRLYRELKPLYSDIELPSNRLPFRPVGYLHELGMLVQLFPVDRHLPTLPRLMTGLPDGFEPSVLHEFGSGEWSIAGCRVEPARYRPGIGATLEFRIRAQDTASDKHAEETFYVKIYRKQTGRQTYDLLSRMSQYCESARPGFDAVRPLANLEKLHAILVARAPGKSLEQILLDRGDVDEAFRRAARALAALHQSDAPMPDRRGTSGELMRVRRAADFLRWARPALGPELDDLVRSIEGRLEEVEPHPTHLDVKSDHIFVDSNRVTFIDMDSYAGADPVYDPATLLARLEVTPSLLPVDPALARQAADAFVEEYFHAVPGEWRRRIGVNYACAALKVALFFVKHIEPEWPAKVEAMLASARTALEGRLDAP